VCGVHFRPQGTVELPGEVLVVLQGADHPKFARCVAVGHDQPLERRVPILRAPELAETDEKQLTLAER
jgi:hypothetical protein